MYTSTRLIPLSKTLLAVENNIQSGVSHVRDVLCFFFKSFSLDSKNDCARPLAITNQSSRIYLRIKNFLDVEMCILVKSKIWL